MQINQGFSCKNFSPLNPDRQQFDDAIKTGKGSSGQTAKYAVSYLEKHKPLLVLIENVPGLCKGFTKRDAVSGERVVDPDSNLAVLLAKLRSLGYVAPYHILNPKARVDVRRARVWFACYFWPALLECGEAAAQLTDMSSELLRHLSQPVDRCYLMGDLLLDESHKVFEFWNRAACSGREQKAAGEVEDSRFKWCELHKQTYTSAGLEWPPVFGTAFARMCQSARMTERECEIVHFYDRTNSVELLAAEDQALDLSQSIVRAAFAGGVMPCITPRSRLWLRRRRRWLLAPEAVACQGYDAPTNLSDWSHRQVLDLIGNSFHGESSLLSLAVALASAPSVATASLRAREEDGGAAM